MKKTTWTPTVQQEKFIEGLLSGLNISEAGEAAGGAARDCWYKSWRHSDDFIAYLEKRRREVAGANMPRVDKKLFEKIDAGDVPAMRLAYEVFGTLRTGQVNINNNAYQPPESEPGKKIAAMLDQLEEKREAKLRLVKE